MKIIRENIQKAIEKLSECESLTKDYEVVQTKSLKCIIDDLQHQTFCDLKEICLAIDKHITEVEEAEKKAAEEEAKPVYFDLVSKGGQVFSRVPEDWNNKEMFEGTKIIRSYNKHNKVVFEDKTLAHLCEDYNELYKKAEAHIKEIISKGRIGLTTKFNNDDRDELEEAYKKMVDKIELPSSEKLPDEFVESVNRVANNIFADNEKCADEVASPAEMPASEEIAEKPKAAKKQVKTKSAKKSKGKTDEAKATK